MFGNTYVEYIEVTNYDNLIYKAVHHDTVTPQEKMLDSTDFLFAKPRTVITEAEHDETTRIDDFPNLYVRVLCKKEATAPC